MLKLYTVHMGKGAGQLNVWLLCTLLKRNFRILVIGKKEGDGYERGYDSDNKRNG